MLFSNMLQRWATKFWVLFNFSRSYGSPFFFANVIIQIKDFVSHYDEKLSQNNHLVSQNSQNIEKVSHYFEMLTNLK